MDKIYKVYGSYLKKLLTFVAYSENNYDDGILRYMKYIFGDTGHNCPAEESAKNVPPNTNPTSKWSKSNGCSKSDVTDEYYARFEEIDKMCDKLHSNITEICNILDTFGNCNYSDDTMTTLARPVDTNPGCSENSSCTQIVDDKKKRKLFGKNVNIYNSIADEIVRTTKTVNKILAHINIVDTNKSDACEISKVLCTIKKYQHKLISITAPDDYSKSEESRPRVNFLNRLGSEHSVRDNRTRNFSETPVENIQGRSKPVEKKNFIVSNINELVKKRNSNTTVHSTALRPIKKLFETNISRKIEPQIKRTRPKSNSYLDMPNNEEELIKTNLTLVNNSLKLTSSTKNIINKKLHNVNRVNDLVNSLRYNRSTKVLNNKIKNLNKVKLNRNTKRRKINGNKINSKQNTKIVLKNVAKKKKKKKSNKPLIELKDKRPYNINDIVNKLQTSRKKNMNDSNSMFKSEDSKLKIENQYVQKGLIKNNSSGGSIITFIKQINFKDSEEKKFQFFEAMRQDIMGNARPNRT